MPLVVNASRPLDQFDELVGIGAEPAERQLVGRLGYLIERDAPHVAAAAQDLGVGGDGRCQLELGLSAPERSRQRIGVYVTRDLVDAPGVGVLPAQAHLDARDRRA